MGKTPSNCRGEAYRIEEKLIKPIQRAVRDIRDELRGAVVVEAVGSAVVHRWALARAVKHPEVPGSDPVGVEHPDAKVRLVFFVVFADGSNGVAPFLAGFILVNVELVLSDVLAVTVLRQRSEEIPTVETAPVLVVFALPDLVECVTRAGKAHPVTVGANAKALDIEGNGRNGPAGRRIHDEGKESEYHSSASREVAVSCSCKEHCASLLERGSGLADCRKQSCHQAPRKKHPGPTKNPEKNRQWL